MFDRISEVAEKVATNVSRRAFMGRLGQGALATAGVLGAMIVFGGKARALGGGFCGNGQLCRGGQACCGGRCVYLKPGQPC